MSHVYPGFRKSTPSHAGALPWFVLLKSDWALFLLLFIDDTLDAVVAGVDGVLLADPGVLRVPWVAGDGAADWDNCNVAIICIADSS